VSHHDFCPAKRRVISYYSVFFFFFQVVCVVPAVGQHTPIKACYADWPPYSFREKSNDLGVSIQIATRAIRNIGSEIVFEQLPWKRCIHQVENGDTELAIDSRDRPNLVCTREATTYAFVVVWAQISRIETKISEISLKNMRIGIALSSEESVPLFQRVGAIPEVAPNDQAVLTKLSLGRTDFAATELLSGAKIVRDLGLAIFPLVPSVGTIELKICGAKSNEALVRKLDSQIAAVRKDGGIDKIYLSAGLDPQSVLVKKFGPQN
jgi:ABC-type amino acid transport substrate-binding protein